MAENSAPEPAKKRKRGAGKPFQKGKSGNPGGRPRQVSEVQKELLEMAPLAVERLRGLVQLGDIEGLKLWFRHVVPPAKESLELSGAVANPLANISTEQLLKVINAGK